MAMLRWRQQTDTERDPISLQDEPTGTYYSEQSQRERGETTVLKNDDRSNNNNIPSIIVILCIYV